MRGRSRLVRWPVVVVALGVVAAACGNGDGGDDEARVVFRVPIAEPAAIDPYNVRESEGGSVAKALFVGLVSYDGNPELVMGPGVATEWSTNGDCTQWTFNLRESEFSNGEPVTAESFIRGWTRTADARSVSQVAYHLAGVEGYDALHGDPQTATTFSGLSAPDPQTLVVDLSAPDCEFDKKTLVPPLSPVPSAAGAADNQEYNEAPIGNGPFMIEPGTRWEHNQRISLVRNDSYFGDPPELDGVEFLIFPAQGRLEAEYRAFTAGEADFARVPPSRIAEAREAYAEQGAFIEFESFGINYLLVNHADGPMADLDARRAVSLALDRDGISDGVYQGSLTPATAFLPPVFGQYHQPEVCDACRHDPDQASELADDGGLTEGTTVGLLYNTDGGHEALVQVLEADLESTLGITVELEGVPFAEMLEKWDRGEFDIARSAWGADYPSVESFLFPLLSSESGDNDGRYSNAEVDRLIAEYRSLTDDTERVAVVQEIERIAIGEDLALIPTWYRTQQRVFDAERFDNVSVDYQETIRVADIRVRS